MKCSQCNADLIEGSQFCSRCGASVAATPPPGAEPAASSAPPPPPPVAPATAAPPASPQPVAQGAPAIKTVSGLYIAYLACAALLIVSAFMKWEALEVSGIEAKSENGFGVVRGWLVFIAAGVAGVMVIASMTRTEPVRWLRLAQIGAGVVAIVMAGIEFSLVSNDSCSASEIFCQQHTAGIGALTALVGGVALAAIALFKGGSPKPAAAVAASPPVAQAEPTPEQPAS